jgi:hypothetical protein
MGRPRRSAPAPKAAQDRARYHLAANESAAPVDAPDSDGENRRPPVENRGPLMYVPLMFHNNGAPVKANSTALIPVKAGIQAAG